MSANNEKILSMMKFCEPMAAHTTFRIGGPVDVWAQPEDLQSLSEILNLCRQDNMRVLVVGNGSNILVKDKGVNGCVINLNSNAFKNIKIEDNGVTVGSGFGISNLLNALSDKGLSGMEFLAGIPATVGGALAMNAGGDKWISGLVEEVNVMDLNGNVSVLNKSDIAFKYRFSGLEKYIILTVKFKLEKSDRDCVRGNIKKYFSQKLKKQELDKPSAGCVFKNPKSASAGRLIDASGFKGVRVGGAWVSTKHANFIVNSGNATCDDVLKLMDIIKERVKKDHGILLETELKVIG